MIKKLFYQQTFCLPQGLPSALLQGAWIFPLVFVRVPRQRKELPPLFLGSLYASGLRVDYELPFGYAKLNIISE
jgi:fucose 4-O-acetylase-like acetyltransferase